MTREEAQAEARKRYGRRGDAWVLEAEGYRWCCVGRIHEQYFGREVMGRGLTYEDALADADRREGKP